jgi:hypothetical protein
MLTPTPEPGECVRWARAWGHQGSSLVDTMVTLT